MHVPYTWIILGNDPGRDWHLGWAFDETSKPVCFITSAYQLGSVKDKPGNNVDPSTTSIFQQGS